MPSTSIPGVAMSEPEPHPNLVERIKQHHERAARKREQAELDADMRAAGFDLGADIGDPAVPADWEAGADVETDLHIESEDPEQK